MKPARASSNIIWFGDPFATAELGNAGFAAQTIQHDADLLFSRIVLPRPRRMSFTNLF
jgi:hypothetical protein